MSNRQHLDQILAAAQKEADIIIHLAEKIDDPTHLDYRPTAGQRSLLETLQAISMMVEITVKFSITGEFDRERAERGKSVTLETFPDAMRAQMAEVHRLLVDITDQDLIDRTSLHPAVLNVPLGTALIRTLVGFLNGYKMQVFLFLKSAGREDLFTANLWRGVDPAPQPAA